MQRHNSPMTRETYLGLAYGDPDHVPEGEQEAMLPEQFQKK